MIKIYIYVYYVQISVLELKDKYNEKKLKLFYTKLIVWEKFVLIILPGRLFTYPPSSNRWLSFGSHSGGM